MQLSMRTDYALRVIFTLVDNHGGSSITIAQLAKRNEIPKPFLEQIMLDLKRGGWVNSIRGKQGGYYLSRSPEEITLGEIVRHFDGYLAPLACVSVTGYRQCTQESVCRFRHLMLRSRNLVAKLMDETTLASAAKAAVVTSYEVSNLQGLGGEGI